jgi:TetR/AcrR family transcriptional repressor of nem operon
MATRDAATPGCLVSCVLADAAGSDPRLRQEFRETLLGMERALAARLLAAEAAGELAPGLSPHTLAPMLAATARGLTLSARGGAGPEELAPVAEVVLRVVTGREAVNTR